MFLVPTDSEGLEINSIDTMGGKETNDVFMTDLLPRRLPRSSARSAAAGRS